MKTPFALLRKTPLSFSLLMVGVGLLSMPASSQTASAIKLAGVYSAHQNDSARQNDSDTGVGSGGSNALLANCSEGPSSVEQDACAQASYDVSNKKLNDAYQLMLRTIRVKSAKDAALLKAAPDNPIIKQAVLNDHEIQNRILASEHMWLQFRDANCNLVAAVDLNGSGEGAQNLYCLNSMTSERVQELLKIMDSIFNRQN